MSEGENVKTYRRFAVLLVLLFAAPASAQVSISIVPDHARYGVGDLVTLEVVAPTGSAPAPGAFARILFDPTVLTNGVVTPASPASGSMPWDLGPTSCGRDSCDVINATQPTSLAVDPLPGDVWATVTFTAAALGTTSVAFESVDVPFALNFFDLFSAPAARVTVAQASPVPSMSWRGAALLFSVMGLSALMLMPQRRDQA